MVHSLSVRVFALTAAVSLVGVGLLGWVDLVMQTRDLEAETVRGALRLSDTLRRSSRASMLKNRKDDVYEIIDTVGDQPGIERIRIFNKGGRITYSTDPGERDQAVNTKAEACNRCHTNGDEPAVRPQGEELTRIFTAADGHRVLGLITPVYNEPGCVDDGCHASVATQKVLGVIDMQTSLAGIDRIIASRVRKVELLTYAVMLLIASACGVFIWRFVHVPVSAVIAGTRRLAAGDLDHRIAVRSRTEIGQLADSFNRMTGELGQAKHELTEWARTLENRVTQKTEIIRQAQAKLVENEKMASLGSLAAIVAHELNNPLSGILTYTKLTRRLMAAEQLEPQQLARIQEYLETMESETARCGRIVSNLLAFSRQSQLSIGSADINGIVRKTLQLIGHKLELQAVRSLLELDPTLGEIICDSDQIQQAMLALLINAVEAMPAGGELKVTTQAVGSEAVEIAIADTGVGIEDDILPHLFEPFFTTKTSKKGVGLGLAVVYGIIKRHQGQINVRSALGRGTVFTIVLPRASDIDDDERTAFVGAAVTAVPEETA